MIGYRKSCFVATRYGFILMKRRRFDRTVSDKVADLADDYLRNIKGSYFKLLHVIQPKDCKLYIFNKRYISLTFSNKSQGGYEALDS